MGALPRPQLDAGPHRDLVEALHALHHRAGWPSLRRLAAEAGCSHTTVSHAFSSPRLPSWGLVEVLVEAMDGDPADLHDLWLAASSNGATSGTTAVAAPVTSATPTTAPRIAGRRAELAAVRHHLETGTGLLLVTGEAGIGKTAVVDAACAGSETFVAVGHCLPLSTEVPMMPVVDLLRAVHDTDDGQWFKEALAGAPAFVRGELSRLLPELADASLGGTGEFSRQHLLAALATCVQQLSSTRALALLVEDVHWADPATLDLMEYLVLHDERVPVVATWRTDDAAVTPGHQAWRDRLCRLSTVSVIALAPLTPEETREQLRLAGDDDAERARRIHGRSGGHPLFTAQLAHQAEEGAPLSPLLTDLLDARLGTLTGPPWTVARAMGLGDRPLETTVLAAAAGLEVDDLTPALRTLASRHLLARRDGGTVSLDHPLLAEAVRRRLVPGEAEEQHRRLALALAAQREPDAAEVSQHWQRAGDREHELEWRIRAARGARARTAPREESEHWLRVLELWPPDAGQHAGLTKAEAQLAAISALEFSGAEDRALALAQEAARDPLEPADRAAILHLAASFTWGQVGPVPALEVADEVLQIRRSLGDDVQVAHILVMRANLLAAAGAADQTLPVLAEARELASGSGDAELMWKVCSTAVWHHAAAGDLAGALAQVDAARTALREPSPRAEIYLAMMHTDALLMHARPADELVAAAERASVVKQRLHLDFTLSHLVDANVAQALVREGRLADAERLVPRGVEASTRYTDWPLRMTAAMVGVARGDLDPALRALELPGQADSLNDLAYRLPGAEALLWRDEPDRALALLLPLLEAVAGRHTGFVGAAVRIAARAAADARAAGLPVAEEARRRILRMRAEAEVDPLGPGPVPGDRLAVTASWSAEMARFDGGDTADGWLEAASHWERLHAIHDAAYCRWRAAQVALREGQATVATRLLRRAASDAQEHAPLSAAIAETRVRAR